MGNQPTSHEDQDQVQTRAVFPADLQQRLATAGIVAVVVIDREEDAIPLAETFVQAGLSAIELTLRTPAALGAIRLIRQQFPTLIVGAGTVLRPAQVQQVQAAGAAFAVAPGFNPRVVRAAEATGLPFAPGVCTPSEIEQALERGCRLLKFFPAQPLGGLSYLTTMAAPYQHLGVQFMPLGGVSQANATEYLASPLVAAVGGSWLATRQQIAEKNWRFIGEQARLAIQSVQAVRGRHD